MSDALHAVLTVAEMRAAEAATGLSELELMQRAGRAAAEWIWRIAAGRSVTVLCGPGNNGGDGYVIAEALRSKGLDVAVVAPADPATGSAVKARSEFQGTVERALNDRHGPIMIDALFGFGLARPIAGEFAKLLEEARASHGYCIAIDVPSGVACDTGAWLGQSFEPDLTLALGAWKRAHWLMPAAAAMRCKRLIDIGVASQNMNRLSSRPRFKAPSADSHKYRRGLAAIVAGEMPGATLLAAEAAMRAGAGYVKLVSHEAQPRAPADLVIENALDRVATERRTGSLLVGPGLGRDDKARGLLAAVLDAAKPTVIDADALHLLDWDALEGVAATRLLLTPHEGELAVLCEAFGVTGSTKLEHAAQLRDAVGATVLAKGPDTILAPADGGVVFFPAASTWLSVAGSGDVLAGIAAARLACHGEPARAAEEAVWLHGEAARVAGPAFTAGDLARAVRPALATFL